MPKTSIQLDDSLGALLRVCGLDNKISIPNDWYSLMVVSEFEQVGILPRDHYQEAYFLS
jgi:hypothetical protein